MYKKLAYPDIQREEKLTKDFSYRQCTQPKNRLHAISQMPTLPPYFFSLRTARNLGVDSIRAL